MDHVRLDHQVVVEELALPRAVALDPADPPRPALDGAIWVCACVGEGQESPTWLITDGAEPGTVRWQRLPDGTEFQGPAGLTEILATKYRDDFVRTATEKLLTYAVGRGVEYYDNPSVRAIMRDAARDNYRISSLILAIVKSTPFQMRRASES